MAEDGEIKSLRKLIDKLLKNCNSLNYKKLKLSGIDSADNVTKEIFTSRVPFTTKSEIVIDHTNNNPFGSNLILDQYQYPKFSKTSGTTSEPIFWVDSMDDWNHMLDAWSIIFNHAGLNPKVDKLFFAFSFGPFLGFWTAYEAASKMQFMTIPGGGLNSNGRLELLADTSASVLLCTPTYALRLGKLLTEKYKINVRKIIVAGESGGSIPEVKQKISQLWRNAEVIDHHGMTEVGPVTYQDQKRTSYLNMLPGFHLAEVIDPKSEKEVNFGEKGELVLTTLKRSDNALLRYKTGDIVEKGNIKINGIDTLTFRNGILGRNDDMHIIRGVNIFPSSIDAIIQKYDTIEEYRVFVFTLNSMKEIELNIELNDSSVELDIIKSLSNDFNSSLSLRIPIRVVPEGTYEKHEFKAIRWINK